MSCPSFRCLNGGQCSTRFNGNYSCECLPSFFGFQCESGSFFYLFYILYSLFQILITFVKQIKWIKIGGLERNEQTILINFYNGLTSKGNLNWVLSTDLCDQDGVVCDSSTPKRIIQLYFSFFLHSSFFFLKKNFEETYKKWNRNLRDKGLQGPIPTQLLSLSYLQSL